MVLVLRPRVLGLETQSLGLGLEVKVLVSVLVLTKKSGELEFFRIYKTGDSHDAGSCQPPAKVPRTSLFASYCKPLPSAEKAAVPLTSVVSLFACLQWLFESVFCTPCTSSPVERIFSHGGLFIRPHRARMSDQLLCDLMLAKCNRQ